MEMENKTIDKFIEKYYWELFLVSIVLLFFTITYSYSIFNKERIEDILFLIIQITIPASIGFLFILEFWWTSFFKKDSIKHLFIRFLDRENTAYYLCDYWSEIYGWTNILGKDAKDSWDILVKKLKLESDGFSGYKERFDFDNETGEIGSFKVLIKKIFRIKETSIKFFLATGILIILSILSVPIIPIFSQNYVFSSVFLILILILFSWSFYNASRLIWLILFEKRKTE